MPSDGHISTSGTPKKTEIVFRRRQTETRSAGVSASAELFVIHVMCDAIFDDVE